MINFPRMTSFFIFFSVQFLFADTFKQFLKNLLTEYHLGSVPILSANCGKFFNSTANLQRAVQEILSLWGKESFLSLIVFERLVLGINYLFLIGFSLRHISKRFERFFWKNLNVLWDKYGYPSSPVLELSSELENRVLKCNNFLEFWLQICIFRKSEDRKKQNLFRELL